MKNYLIIVFLILGAVKGMTSVTYAQTETTIITPDRTKLFLQEYSYNIDIHKIQRKTVNVPLLDTIKTINPKHAEAKAKFEIINNINSFRRDTSKFKIKKKFLANAQKIADEIGLKVYIFNLKLGWSKYRGEQLQKYLRDLTYSISEYLIQPMLRNSETDKNLIRNMKDKLAYYPEFDIKIVKSDSTIKLSKLLLDDTRNRLTELNGDFFVSDKKFIKYNQEVAYNLKNEIVEWTRSAIPKHANIIRTVIVDNKTGDLYLSEPSDFLERYEFNIGYSTALKKIESYGYSVIKDGEGNRFKVNGITVYMTKNILKDPSKEHINQIASSLKKFKSTMPEADALGLKLSKHISAYRNGTMTVTRLSTWAKDCKAGIAYNERLKRLKGWENDVLWSISQHFDYKEIKDYTDFKQLLDGSIKIIGL